MNEYSMVKASVCDYPHFELWCPVCWLLLCAHKGITGA